MTKILAMTGVAVVLAFSACTTVMPSGNVVPGNREGYDEATGAYYSYGMHNGAPSYLDSNGYFKTMTDRGLYLQGKLSPDGEYYAVDRYGHPHGGWATPNGPQF